MDNVKAFGATALTVVGILAVLKLAAKYVGPVAKARDYILK